MAKAHQFVPDVYKHTQNFPKDEIYALTSQFRRAAVSVAANIAEGFTKRGYKDKNRFYTISEGSLEECRYYLILSGDLNYGKNNSMDQQAEEVSKIPDGLIRSIITNN